MRGVGAGRCGGVEEWWDCRSWGSKWSLVCRGELWGVGAKDGELLSVGAKVGIGGSGKLFPTECLIGR